MVEIQVDDPIALARPVPGNNYFSCFRNLNFEFFNQQIFLVHKVPAVDHHRRPLRGAVEVEVPPALVDLIVKLLFLNQKIKKIPRNLNPVNLNLNPEIEKKKVYIYF